MKLISSKVELVHCSHIIAENMETDADLLPLYSARVSYGNDGKTGQSEENDDRLMKFLAVHGHLSPFEHSTVGFKITAPLFVAREWMRHKSQHFNEISMRYTDKTIGEFWYPNEWRKPHATNKQSSDDVITDENISQNCYGILYKLYDASVNAYHDLLSQGVAKELARSVIPVGHMTEFYASATIRDWAAFCIQRLAPGAQQEIRELAEEVSNHIESVYPRSWKALKEGFIKHDS